MWCGWGEVLRTCHGQHPGLTVIGITGDQTLLRFSLPKWFISGIGPEQSWGLEPRVLRGIYIYKKHIFSYVFPLP